MSNFWLDMNIQGALSGDTHAAWVVLIYASDYLSKGDPLPDNLREYLAQSFDKIIKEGNADSALNLKNKRGRKQSDGLRNFSIAGDIKNAMNEGYTLEKACHLVGDKYNLSHRTIEKIYYSTNPLLKLQD